jgi:oxaloacetate decarboxylase alpha subunit
VAEIQLLDVSLRDGNQSLWGATGLTTPQILQIAPVMDRVGFRALDYTSSTHMGVAVRTHREDPWERIRLTHAAMPNTPLQFIGTGLRFISWEQAHPDLMQLAYDRLVANGITRFVVLDPMHDVGAILQSARMLRQAGAVEIIAALTYTISAVHDDEFYANLASQIAACADIDRAYIKDPAGLLAPERARTLIPAVRERLVGKPLELHSHCTIGLSPLSYLTAADLGVEVLQVACGPLANGTSLPNAQRVVANLRELGHTVDIDDRLLEVVADYFWRLAAAESLPAGAPQEYDASFLRHQVAGGVMTTTRRQLRELGLEDRFDAVMAEVDRVRAELGYPIMVTPFPQMVCSQALYNVIGAQRYANVPDQVIRYVLGSFGRPTAPVDPDVKDKILSRPRARELAAEPPPPSPAELRRRFAPGISDEELLLRATMPAEQVDAMLAAGPAKRHYNPDLEPVLTLLRELRGRPPLTELTVDKPRLRLRLRGGEHRSTAHA